MKRIVLAAVVALAGCSSALTGETYSKEAELKLAYRAETNESLPAPHMDLFCPWSVDDSCYIHAWQYTFDENIKIYRDKQKDIAEAKRAEELAEKEKACRANPDCMKDREINEHKNVAGVAYNYFTGRYAMNRDEFDYRTRKMCDAAITSQRNGASLNQLIGMIADTPGGDQTDRMLGMDLAKSCWYLGSLGVTSSKDILPSYTD